MSTAEPAAGPSLPRRPDLLGPGRHPRIVILDTGLAGGVDDDGRTNPDSQRPTLLDATGSPQRIAGTIDRADDEITPADGGAAFPPDGYLDPVAGHGTFIAGLIEQLAQGCEIRIERVIQPLGDGRELDIVAAIEAEAARPPAERADILSMSFGGAVFEHAFALRTAIAAARLAGIVLVASAGNDGTCVPQYPAAFDEVIGVGAVGRDGPPPWTNYGDWVDACAPGVELVSAFFASFDGAFPMMNSVDIDKFTEWACWSGTSFSGPVVVAALAREMVIGDCAAAEAVQRVVSAPHLLRFPCLGTVVNL
jgi:subtilisin family serine protease